MSDTTRAEHIEWCKKRALEYCKPGQWHSLHEAFSSMVSDLSKHDETKGHIGIMLGMQTMLVGGLNSPAQMKDFYNGFN